MEFNLIGEGFDILPDDAIGIVSGNNDNPLQYIDTESEYYIVRQISKSNNEMSLRSTAETSFTSSKYLGVIVSPDRKTIYWQNNTRPMP